MWKFKDLHEEYKKKNLKESDFISKTLTIRLTIYFFNTNSVPIPTLLPSF